MPSQWDFLVCRWKRSKSSLPNKHIDPVISATSVLSFIFCYKEHINKASWTLWGNIFHTVYTEQEKYISFLSVFFKNKAMSFQDNM